MKLIVRTFVVALALTGAAATALTPAASAQHKVITGRTSFMPIAVCPPNDPNGCLSH
jgi:hypothetical protein